MDSKNLKQILYDLGADICGIASIDRFNDTYEGFNPTDTLPSCRSVAVFGKKFLKGTMDCKNTVPYTIVRNVLSGQLDSISVDFCNILENEKIIAVPVGTIGPCIYDKRINWARSIISVKYAAVLAGLGYIGKNTLLITPEYGNMVWLTAVLMNIELEPDEIINKNCPENCFLCIESCPVGALNKGNSEIDRLKCLQYAFRTNENENFYIKCNKCRTICPNCLGTKNRDL